MSNHLFLEEGVHVVSVVYVSANLYLTHSCKPSSPDLHQPSRHKQKVSCKDLDQPQWFYDRQILTIVSNQMWQPHKAPIISVQGKVKVGLWVVDQLLKQFLPIKSWLTRCQHSVVYSSDGACLLSDDDNYHTEIFFSLSLSTHFPPSPFLCGSGEGDTILTKYWQCSLQDVSLWYTQPAVVSWGSKDGVCS